MNIKLRVQNLINKCGTGNPESIADMLGICIMPIPLPDDIRGFFVRVLRRKYIVINDRLSATAGKVVICHELGHARLHIGYGYHFHFNGTYYAKARFEREANEYALHLLTYTTDVDSDLIFRYLDKRRPDPMVVHQILNEFSRVE